MRRKLAIVFALGSAIVWCTTGCTSIPSKVAAPVPVLGHGNEQSQLEKGRSTYVSFLKCAMCHRPKPVYDYDPDTWKDDILPRMGKKARLNAEQYAAVLAYVTSDIAQTRPQDD